jgi:hypothetical protein
VREGVRGHVFDVDLGVTPARRQAQDARGLVAADKKCARFVDGESVGQPRQVISIDFGRSGATVRCNRNSGDAPGEGLADKKGITVRSQSHAVGEGECLLVPEQSSASPNVIRPNAGSRRCESMAVGNQQAAAVMVHYGIVWNLGARLGKALQLPVGEVEPEDGGVFEVAGE